MASEYNLSDRLRQAYDYYGRPVVATITKNALQDAASSFAADLQEKAGNFVKSAGDTLSSVSNFINEKVDFPKASDLISSIGALVSSITGVITSSGNDQNALLSLKEWVGDQIVKVDSDVFKEVKTLFSESDAVQHLISLIPGGGDDEKVT